MSLPAENIRQIDGPVSQVPALQSETAAVMNMIERAARDPAVDIDKLQRLMEMREKIERQTAERSFNASMRAAQSEMRPVAADAANPQTRSRYATYAALDRALRPVYTKHGFALSFDEADSPKPDHIRVLCYVTHDAGFSRTYHKDMPADGKGAKGGDVMTKTHATGAAASYGARYLLKGIFNVAVGDDDRDGNAPDAPYTPPEGSISPDQVESIREQLRLKNCAEKAFLQWAKQKRIEDIPADLYEPCMDGIASFKKGSK
jgi:hypothetical protein